MNAASFHPLAERELIDAGRFYESRAPGLGHALVNEVEMVVGQIAQQPAAAPRVRGNVWKRALHRFPYSLLYVVEADRIRILALMSHKRRPDYWLGRATPVSAERRADR